MSNMSAFSPRGLTPQPAPGKSSVRQITLDELENGLTRTAAHYWRMLRGERNLPPQYRAFWMPTPLARRRRGLRWWLMAALIVALGVLLLKPLAVLAAVLVAVVVGVLIIGLLAAGALLLAVRVVLGGRLPLARAPWHFPRR